MTKAATISKLESLLNRIRTRGAEPRRVVRAAPSVVEAAMLSSAVAAPAAPAPPPVVARAPVAAPPPVAPPPVAAPPSVVARAPVAAPPPVAPPEPPPAEETTIPPPAGDLDFTVDVDVAATPEPPAAEPVAARDPFESRERIAAAPSVEPETLAEPASLDAGPAIEQVEVLSDEEAMPGEEEPLDEAPASSRRPVAAPPEERLADLAFGAEEARPPRHTPPPKSGRLPAPPALEFDGDVTGVRETPVSVDDEATQLSAQAPEPSPLVPQAARPNLASSVNARVADVVGEAQRFAPATFVELLDASLSL